MAQTLEQKVLIFAKRYGALFDTEGRFSADQLEDIAQAVGQCYRPGFTFFTNGKIDRFDTQAQAASLIHTEMLNNITNNLANRMTLDNITVQVYSSTSALAFAEWSCHPQPGSKITKGWTFRNVYGYRKDAEETKSGWEFVIRDDEVESMRRATGVSFDG